MYLGDFNSDVAVPITGSDRVTTGYSPSTMHVDPASGVDYVTETMQAEAPAPVTVVVTPASTGPSMLLLAALAFGAWYAYKQGWFTEILQSVGVHE